MSTRRWMYRIARLMGDYNAIRRGRMGRRMARRSAGRAAGRTMGRHWR